MAFIKYGVSCHFQTQNSNLRQFKIKSGYKMMNVAAHLLLEKIHSFAALINGIGKVVTLLF